MVTMRLVTKADESRQTKKTVVASHMVIMVLILTRITTNTPYLKCCPSVKQTLECCVIPLGLYRIAISPVGMPPLFSFISDLQLNRNTLT